MRRLLTILAAAAVLAVAAVDADARSSGKSGYCPAGSCARSGGAAAGNLKNCSPANCRGERMPTKAQKR